MRSLQTIFLSLAVSVALGAIASADVQVSIHDGQVSIVARDATVGQILSEWAKVGQTRFLNLEKVAGERMTIELTDVSEERALEIVLRRVSGYIAARRPVADPKASTFDRIVLLANSVVQPSAAPVPTSAARTPTYNAPSRAYQAPPPDPPDAPEPADAAPAPVFTTEPAGGGGDASDTSDGEPSVAVVGMTPLVTTTPPGSGTRQALETVNPRTFKIPPQPQSGTVFVPGAAGPTGVAVPGMIVQPPTPPRPRGGAD